MGVRQYLLLSMGLLFLLSLAGISARAALLSESAIGPEAGLNNSDLYASATDAWYQPQYNVTQLITSGSCSASAPCLWVPWYGSSSSCIATGQNESGDLKAGSSCNSSEPINATNNCMVSDEFSQVGLDLSMGQNQTRFQQFHNTCNVINSSRAKIPAWRVYRSGNTIEACRTNINGNCDTAADATARIIIAHWNAANNSFFTNQTQKNNYAGLALNLTIAMVQSEITFACRNSSIGSGQICWWLRAGNQSSLTSSDGGYTGYYPDVEIALLQTCSQTGNLTYCAIAGNISLNEKQAAKWNGSAFRAPPGRSYKWDNFSSASVPYANCTNTCGDSAVDGDETWDASDAIREFFEGTANYYDRFILQTNVLANSTSYMAQWVAEKMVGNLNSLPIQYYPNGNNSGSNQSGYVAQAMQAAGIISQNNATQVNTTVWNAMNHYTHSTHKWDSAACPGVYNTAFPIRMLGVGMGRDAASFASMSGSSSAPVMQGVSVSPSVAFANSTLYGFCNATDTDSTYLSYTGTWFRNGTVNTTQYSPLCYQDDADAVSACGGLGTGSYSYPTGSDTSWHDGLWNNVVTSAPLGTYFYTNWTKPTNATVALYKSMMSNVEINFTNTLPSSCIANTVQVRLQYNAPTYPVECYNASGSWEVFGNNYIAASFFGPNEEGMFWLIPNLTQGVNVTIGNLSGLQKNQNWTFMCTATDGTLASGAVNSTSILINNTPPANNWSANNQTFNHNASIVFGNYCSDADVGDTIVYSTNNTIFPILSNGSINWTTNVSRSGNYSVNISCSDGTANTTVTVWLNVTNSIPNVSANLTPLPAQAGTGLNTPYSCTDPDNDVCNTTAFYAWFKNGVLNTTITGNTFGPGNFTTGDNITGSVRVYDGNLNSTWQNTSTATVGDTTPPIATNFSVSPQSVTTSSSTTISVNCTDNNQIGSAYAEVADTLGARTNFSMTLQSGNVYAYSYTPPFAGTYAARSFCVDGNGNSANSSSIAFTASAPGTVVSNGGGSGSGDSGLCSFVLLQPVTRIASNPLCPTGGTSQDLTISVQNNLLTSTDFHLNIPENRCTAVPSTLTLGGGQKGSITMTNCSCPTVDGQEDDLNISVVQASSVCSQQFTLQLTSSQFGNVIQNPAALLIVVGIIFVLAILFIVVIGAIAKRIQK